MTSPAWHQLLWEHLSADPSPSRGQPRNGATLVALLDITRELFRTRFETIAGGPVPRS